MLKFALALAVLGALALITVVTILSARRAPADRARFLQWAGLGLAGLFTLVGAPWIAAGAVGDAGGWAAAGRIAAWLVPPVVLLAIVWYRAAWATALLGALAAAAVGASAWYAVDPDAWRAFEDRNGAIRVIGSFALVAPIALLGWRRPRPAGVLLVVLGLVPLALSAIGTFDGLASLVAVSVVPVIIGVLYLLADAVGRPSPARSAAPAEVTRG